MVDMRVWVPVAWEVKLHSNNQVLAMKKNAGGGGLVACGCPLYALRC
nr:hypothetical protein [uncultured Desulfobacter sp.]